MFATTLNILEFVFKKNSVQHVSSFKKYFLEMDELIFRSLVTHLLKFSVVRLSSVTNSSLPFFVSFIFTYSSIFQLQCSTQPRAVVFRLKLTIFYPISAISVNLLSCQFLYFIDRSLAQNLLVYFLDRRQSFFWNIEFYMNWSVPFTRYIF